MRLALWISLFAASTLFAGWVVIFSGWNLQDEPIAARFAIVFFVFFGGGPYWMLYDSFRHDRRLTPKMGMSFVPGGFIWYYFECVKKRKRLVPAK
jgi:hypothetical protein